MSRQRQLQTLNRPSTRRDMVSRDTSTSISILSFLAPFLLEAWQNWYDKSTVASLTFCAPLPSVVRRDPHDELRPNELDSRCPRSLAHATNCGAPFPGGDGTDVRRSVSALGNVAFRREHGAHCTPARPLHLRLTSCMGMEASHTPADVRSCCGSRPVRPRVYGRSYGMGR